MNDEICFFWTYSELTNALLCDIIEVKGVFWVTLPSERGDGAPAAQAAEPAPAGARSGAEQKRSGGEFITLQHPSSHATRRGVRSETFVLFC